MLDTRGLYLSVLFFFVAFWSLTGQSRVQLEKKKARIQSEINRINSDLKKTRSQEKDILQVYELTEKKIRLRQNLINTFRAEIKLLDRKIKVKNDSVQLVNQELKNLKKEYAEAVRKAYKFSSKEKVLYFILSSESFRQAWRRIRYLKEYADFVKKKAEQIEEKERELKNIIAELELKKNEKKNVLTRLYDEQAALKKEKDHQEVILKKLKKQKKTYLAQIRRKQRELRKLDKMIERLIAKEIAERNKKTGSRSRDFVLTPEGKKLASAFSANKGRLPWPVKRGYISRRFGKQPHPVYKNVYVVNSGININVPDNEKARSVFNGEVMMIQLVPGGNQYVYIRHGNYITIYGNLKDVSVKKGQKIRTGQILGTVAKDPASGISVLKFRIYLNRQKLNPELWLARK